MDKMRECSTWLEFTLELKLRENRGFIETLELKFTFNCSFTCEIELCVLFLF